MMFIAWTSHAWTSGVTLYAPIIAAWFTCKSPVPLLRLLCVNLRRVAGLRGTGLLKPLSQCIEVRDDPFPILGMGCGPAKFSGDPLMHLPHGFLGFALHRNCNDHRAGWYAVPRLQRTIQSRVDGLADPLLR